MAPPTLTPVTWTSYADLDDLLGELLGHWRGILGNDLAGAWVQGSFALGAGDLQSDCDWIVATHRPLTDEQVAALREVHDEIPTRGGHWPHDIEGSYAPLAELVSVDHLGREWLFNDHGHRTLVWDDHCNRGYTRWILREHGVTLTGPEPRSFMAEVPADLLRAEARAAIPTLIADLATWMDIDTSRGASGTPSSRRRASSTRSRRPRSPASPVRWSGRSAPSTPGGGRCWVRCATTARSGSCSDRRRGPARRTRRGPSRRTPWSGPRRTTSLRP